MRTSEDETLLGLGQVCEGVEGVRLLPCLEGITPAISVSFKSHVIVVLVPMIIIGAYPISTPTHSPAPQSR